MWNSNGNAIVRMVTMTTRFFSSSSRKRAPNLRKTNPRVPFEEAAHIAEGLYGVIKSRGPLTVGGTWDYAKDGGISGLSSKTHMKLMLKWMRGRSMLKQICNHVGSSKKFLLTTLPEGPQLNEQKAPTELKLKSRKRPKSDRRKAR